MDDDLEVDGADVAAVAELLSGVLTSGEGDNEAVPAIANRCIFASCTVDMSSTCVIERKPM